MPVEIRWKQYFTVAERIAMIHADFPDAVGIETEIVHTDTSLDYDQLAARIIKAFVPHWQSCPGADAHRKQN